MLTVQSNGVYDKLTEHCRAASNRGAGRRHGCGRRLMYAGFKSKAYWPQLCLVEQSKASDRPTAKGLVGP